MTEICLQAAHGCAGGAAEGASAGAPHRLPTRPLITRGARARALAIWREWRRRSRDREKLAALDDRMLQDLGITRAEAEILSHKPFWRA